jgi:hypothetical protein
MYETGSCDRPAAIYVAPKSFDSVCPGELPAAIAEIASDLARISGEIQGATRGLLHHAGAILDARQP